VRPLLLQRLSATSDNLSCQSRCARLRMSLSSSKTVLGRILEEDFVSGSGAELRVVASEAPPRFGCILSLSRLSIFGRQEVHAALFLKV